MTENQAKKIFEKYNPASDIKRCPKGRAKMRKLLDTYAKASVNLYGIIRIDEFADIFNSQNEEQTTSDEVYTILLPNVLKYGWYGFYMDYIVHYIILHDFDWVDYIKREQTGKPRYIPPKEKFLMFECEEYQDNDHWTNVCKFMWDAFGISKNTSEGFQEIKDYITYNSGIREIGTILEKHNLIFNDTKQIQKFFDLLTLAKNNTRIWENKGHTPEEIHVLLANSQSEEFIIHQPKKVGPNDPCPCGSGKKFKKCCALIENSGASQISYNESKLFYEIWYKLLDFVNKKLDVVNYKINPHYLDFHDETLLHKIRNRLWENPKLISEFLDGNNTLKHEEIRLLKAWEKHHIKGRFFLLKYELEHAIFMRMDKSEPSKLYAVKGMTTSVAEIMHLKLPVLLETVLLPFKDKIIYDSFMNSHNIQFDDGIRDMLENEYVELKNKYGIITRLE